MRVQAAHLQAGSRAGLHGVRHLGHREAELGVHLPGLDVGVCARLDAGSHAHHHALRAAAQTLDLVEGVDHDVADAALDRVVELGRRLVVAVHVQPLGIHPRRKRQVELAAGGHVGGQALVGEQLGRPPCRGTPCSRRSPRSAPSGRGMPRRRSAHERACRPRRRRKPGCRTRRPAPPRRNRRPRAGRARSGGSQGGRHARPRAPTSSIGDYERAMRHPTPTPPELGVHDGLAYALFLPEGEPDVGVVVLHGGGSSKESHSDFARGCRADGMAALAYDARGHGESDGSFGPGAIDEALAMVELLRAHAPTRGAARVEHGRLPGHPRRSARPIDLRRGCHLARRPRLACCASSARARNWSSGATPRRARPGSSRSI